jgi:hypothetical protein
MIVSTGLEFATITHFVLTPEISSQNHINKGSTSSEASGFTCAEFMNRAPSRCATHPGDLDLDIPHVRLLHWYPMRPSPDYIPGIDQYHRRVMVHDPFNTRTFSTSFDH